MRLSVWKLLTQFMNSIFSYTIQLMSLYFPPPNCHHNDNYLLNNCFIPDWLYQLPVQTPSALPFRYNALLQQLLKINLICFATYVT